MADSKSDTDIGTSKTDVNVQLEPDGEPGSPTALQDVDMSPQASATDLTRSRDVADAESLSSDENAPIPHGRGWRGVVFAPCRFFASCRCSPRSIRSRLSMHSLRDACSMCRLARPRDYLGFLFIILAYCFLYPGLFIPVISLEQKGPKGNQATIRSTWETVVFMLKKGGEYAFPGCLLLFFSICVPFLKGFLLIMALSCGRKPRLLRFVARISKYQVVDIFVTIMLVGYTNCHFVKAEVMSGFYFFLAYCVFSIVGSTILATGEDTREKLKPIGLLWAVLSIVMLVSLVLALYLPLFHVSAAYEGIIVDSVRMSVGELIGWLFTHGFIPQAMLIVMGIVVLPITAYIILPLLPVREEAKSRMISVAHEWAMADTWFVAFLVGWTSFDTNGDLIVQVSGAGTYFNLVYGFSAFVIFYFIIGDAQPATLSDEAITVAQEEGQDVQLLARQIDLKNFKKKSSVAAIMILAIVPGLILSWLVHVEGVTAVDMKYLNDKLGAHCDQLNDLAHDNVPMTIGCCRPMNETCNDRIGPDIVPVPPGKCIPVGSEGVLSLGTYDYQPVSHLPTFHITYAARWITNLKSITLSCADQPPAFDLSARMDGNQSMIDFTVRGNWSDLPMSFYAYVLGAWNYNGTECCFANQFTISASAECHSEFPYMRNFEVSRFDLNEVDIILPVNLKVYKGNITIANITPKIIDAVTQAIDTVAKETKMQYWPYGGEQVTFMDALNYIIKVNLDGDTLRCPDPPNSTKPNSTSTTTSA